MYGGTCATHIKEKKDSYIQQQLNRTPFKTTQRFSNQNKQADGCLSQSVLPRFLYYSKTKMYRSCIFLVYDRSLPNSKHQLAASFCQPLPQLVMTHVSVSSFLQPLSQLIMTHVSVNSFLQPLPQLVMTHVSVNSFLQPLPQLVMTRLCQLLPPTTVTIIYDTCLCQLTDSILPPTNAIFG